MYPALAEVHGSSYVDTLLEEHEEALEAARQLAELLSKKNSITKRRTMASNWSVNYCRTSAIGTAWP